MALQHHEFELRLRDAERLRLYVHASIAEREMCDASLKKVELEFARVQNALALAEEARRRAEHEHGASQEALAAAEEACKKAEEENGHLADEKLTLVIELGP